MGVSERKERERKEMQRLILETAMKLFLEEGYENVSIRKIAEKIEYSPATIYLYFKDKDQILYALYKVAFERFYQRLQPVETIADPLKRLRQGGIVYLKFAFDHPEYYDLMFIMRAPIRKILNEQEPEFGAQGFEMLMTTLKECREQGRLTEKNDLEAVSLAVWSFLHGMASLVTRHRVRMIPEERLKPTIGAALDFMLASILGSPEKKG